MDEACKIAADNDILLTTTDDGRWEARNEWMVVRASAPERALATLVVADGKDVVIGGRTVTPERAAKILLGEAREQRKRKMAPRPKVEEEAADAEPEVEDGS